MWSSATACGGWSAGCATSRTRASASPRAVRSAPSSRPPPRRRTRWRVSKSTPRGCVRNSEPPWRWQPVADATCMGCGCVCDDIDLTPAGPTRTCPLGDVWFAERGGDRPPVARVDGRTVSVDEAVDAAAAILREARAPLVYGLGQTSCEAQRRAVALAEAIGGV